MVERQFASYFRSYLGIDRSPDLYERFEGLYVVIAGRPVEGRSVVGVARVDIDRDVASSALAQPDNFIHRVI